MKKIKNILRYILKIYRFIMRIKHYVDVKGMIAEFKKDNPNINPFNYEKPKRGRVENRKPVRGRRDRRADLEKRN